MPITQTAARDEMLARVKAAAESVTPTAPTMVWEDVEGSLPRGITGAWVRARVQHTDGGQATLTNADGVRRYDRMGVLLVEVNTPSGQGLQLSDSISSTIRGAFEGYSTPGGVWFRNARVNEGRNDGIWFRMNVLIDFEYDEIK